MLWIEACEEAGVDPVYAWSQIVGIVRVKAPDGTVAWVPPEEIKRADIAKLEIKGCSDYSQLLEDLRNC